jgi:hypothetical protein
VDWAQAATIVSALAAFTGLQALWISRGLDRVHATLDRLDSRFDHVEGVVLRDHTASGSPGSKPLTATDRR